MTRDESLLIAMPGEGQPFPGAGTIVCKVSSEATAGAFTVLELKLEPNQGPPLHSHEFEDEFVYVESGACAVGTRTQEWVLTAGSCVVFPKQMPHFFRNDGEHSCTLLITAVPGGLDRYFAAVSSAVLREQPEHIATINAQYGIQFISQDQAHNS